MGDCLFACNFDTSVYDKMVLSEIKQKYRSSLADLYPAEEINSLFEIAAEDCLFLSRSDLHKDPDKFTSPEAEKKMLNILDRLVSTEPIQYIIGSCFFYELSLNIRPGVLIPRQETEFLVDLIIKDPDAAKSKKILDLCTGSGCIAIALKKHLSSASVSAMDISDMAIALAEENAQLNKLNIFLLQDDLLKPAQRYEKYDLIVSNPPYVRNSEKQKMHRNVLDHEPGLALFVEDDDPLIFYRAIADFAFAHGRSAGIVYLEINEFLGKEMLRLYRDYGFQEIDLIKDLNGKTRYLRCKIK